MINSNTIFLCPTRRRSILSYCGIAKKFETRVVVVSINSKVRFTFIESNMIVLATFLYCIIYLHVPYDRVFQPALS